MSAIDKLKEAFCRDDAEAIREALRARPELRKLVNEPIGPFDSPSITGVRSREMLDLLLEYGADINAKSKWWAGGFCLLDGASDELAEYAISRGAIVEIHAAARLGKINRLRELVQGDPQLVHARGGDGKTPLHFARTVEIARFLLDRGAEIDARDIDHESTAAQHLIGERHEVVRFLVEQGCWADLFLAAALGDLKLAKTFVDEDASCLQRRINKETFPMKNPHAGGTIYIWTLGSNLSPHQVANKFGHNEVFKYLMEKSPPEVRLVNWCWLGDEHEAKKILSEDTGLAGRLSGVDRRAVVDAARENETKAAMVMLDAGLPIDGRGQHSGTALHWAAWHGNTDVVEALLRHGAASHLEIRDDDHHATPIEWAAHGSENSWHRQTGDYEAVMKLLKAAKK